VAGVLPGVPYQIGGQFSPGFGQPKA